MGGEKRRSWQQGGHMRGRPGPTFRPPRSHPKQQQQQQHVPSGLCFSHKYWIFMCFCVYFYLVIAMSSSSCTVVKLDLVLECAVVIGFDLGCCLEMCLLD